MHEVTSAGAVASASVNEVLQNEDLMWLIVGFLTGLQTSQMCSRQQNISDPRSTFAVTASAAPLLPLLLTFRSLRRTRMQQLGIPLVSIMSQFVTSVSMVEWAMLMGCNFRTMRRTRAMCTMAAMRGQVDLLQWLRSLAPPCPWNEETCAFAADGGHLNVLAWLRSQTPPCPWNEETCAVAAGRGHLDLLMWLRSQKPPCPWNSSACSSAAAGGHLKVLQWLRSQENSCPWSAKSCLNAARGGNLEVLQWLRSQDPKCPWDDYSCAKASAEGGHLMMLQWVSVTAPDAVSRLGEITIACVFASFDKSPRAIVPLTISPVTMLFDKFNLEYAIAALAEMSSFSMFVMLFPVPFASKVLLVSVAVELPTTDAKSEIVDAVCVPV